MKAPTKKKHSTQSLDDEETNEKGTPDPKPKPAKNHPPIPKRRYLLISSIKNYSELEKSQQICQKTSIFFDYAQRRFPDAKKLGQLKLKQQEIDVVASLLIGIEDCSAIVFHQYLFKLIFLMIVVTSLVVCLFYLVVGIAIMTILVLLLILKASIQNFLFDLVLGKLKHLEQDFNSSSVSKSINVTIEVRKSRFEGEAKKSKKGKNESTSINSSFSGHFSSSSVSSSSSGHHKSTKNTPKDKGKRKVIIDNKLENCDQIRPKDDKTIHIRLSLKRKGMIWQKEFQNKMSTLSSSRPLITRKIQIQEGLYNSGSSGSSGSSKKSNKVKISHVINQFSVPSDNDIRTIQNALSSRRNLGGKNGPDSFMTFGVGISAGGSKLNIIRRDQQRNYTFGKSCSKFYEA